MYDFVDLWVVRVAMMKVLINHRDEANPKQVSSGTVKTGEIDIAVDALQPEEAEVSAVPAEQQAGEVGTER